MKYYLYVTFIVCKYQLKIKGKNKKNINFFIKKICKLSKIDYNFSQIVSKEFTYTFKKCKNETISEYIIKIDRLGIWDEVVLWGSKGLCPYKFENIIDTYGYLATIGPINCLLSKKVILCKKTDSSIIYTILIQISGHTELFKLDYRVQCIAQNEYFSKIDPQNIGKRKSSLPQNLKMNKKIECEEGIANFYLFVSQNNLDIKISFDNREFRFKLDLKAFILCNYQSGQFKCNKAYKTKHVVTVKNYASSNLMPRF